MSLFFTSDHCTYCIPDVGMNLGFSWSFGCRVPCEVHCPMDLHTMIEHYINLVVYRNVFLMQN
jgi:hypothetical protein